MSEDRNLAIATELVRSVNADRQSLEELYAVDAEVWNGIEGTFIKGREAVQNLILALDAIDPKRSMEVRTMFASDEQVVIDSSYVVNGKAHPCIMFLTFDEGGKILCERTYMVGWDHDVAPDAKRPA